MPSLLPPGCNLLHSVDREDFVAGLTILNLLLKCLSNTKTTSCARVRASMEEASPNICRALRSTVSHHDWSTHPLSQVGQSVYSYSWAPCCTPQGCIFFPKIEFFINHYLESLGFFMVRNGNFGPNLVVFEPKIRVFYKMDPVFL